MKFVLAIVCVAVAVSDVSAVCRGTAVGIVVTQIITGPPELVKAILTPLEEQTENDKELISQKENDIIIEVLLNF